MSIDRIDTGNKLADRLRGYGMNPSDELLGDLIDIVSDASETLREQQADKPIQVRTTDRATRTATVAAYNKMSDVSDGYHTFGELYQIRMLYNAGFFNELQRFHVSQMQMDKGGDAREIVELVAPVKSYRHHDGELCFGKENYFVVVAQLPTGQISNHYKGEYWDLFNIPEVEKAPEWDGHTPQQAAERLEKYLRGEY
jgi:hypothetical protein